MSDAAKAPITLVTPKNGFAITLKSRSNPDRAQDPNRSVSPPKLIKVKTLKEASQAALDYIQENDLGMGNWVAGAGDVYDVDNKKEPVAQISYNGRAWVPGPWPRQEIAL